MEIEYFYVSLELLNIKEIWDYIWHHQAYYIKIYEQLHQKPLSFSCIETDLFWHKRYMAGCSLRLMRRPWRFLLDVILWNNTCQLLPDPRKGGRFSRSSCHLSAPAHLSLHITTWSVLTGLAGSPASLARWEPGAETVWGHHLWFPDLIITEVMKMCTQIEMLLNKCMALDSWFFFCCFLFFVLVFFFLFSLPPPSSLSQFQQKPCLGFPSSILQSVCTHLCNTQITVFNKEIKCKCYSNSCTSKITSVLCTALYRKHDYFSEKAACCQILKPYWLLLDGKIRLHCKAGAGGAWPGDEAEVRNGAPGPAGTAPWSYYRSGPFDSKAA